MAPDFDRKHYTRVDTPEECAWLLASTFLSPLFWGFGPVYSYLEWFKGQERLQAYYEYRLLLQVLQAVDPTRRLALKAPTHTGAVEALLQTVPGALLIQTHRNPAETSASLTSLFYSLHSLTTERLDVRRMTEAILSLQEHQIERNLAARDLTLTPCSMCTTIGSLPILSAPSETSTTITILPGRRSSRSDWTTTFNRTREANTEPIGMLQRTSDRQKKP